MGTSRRKRFMKNTLHSLGMLALGAALIGGWARPSSADKLITGGADKKVKIWDAATGKMLKEVDAHEKAVNVIALSPNGKTLATGGADKKVKLWSLEDGKLIKEIEAHSGGVTSLQFTLDGEKLITGGGDKTIKTWDAVSGKEGDSVKDAHDGDVITIFAVPEPKMTISYGKDGAVKFWDDSGNAQFTIPHEGVTAMAVNPVSPALYTADKDGNIKWWTQDAGSGDFSESQGSAINVITILPDGKKMLSGSADGKIKIWDTDSKKLLGTVDAGHKGGVTAIATDPKGKTIFTAGTDGKVKVWDAETKKNVATVEDAHKDGVTAILYLSDKKADEPKKEDKKKDSK
jgi:WD40 repeat protein